MKIKTLLLAVVTLGLVAGVAYVAQQLATPADRMTAAGEKFVGSLTAEQKKKALFDFDSKERTNWNFVPLQDKNKKSTRKGMSLEDMTADQRKAVMDLLAAGTSEGGYQRAVTIMSLESILRDLEKPKGSMVRDPNWYFVTIFGTPSKQGQWGWRIEGHHLSLNYTIKDGKIAAVTPAFFGANPAVVMAGAKKGLETLPGAETLALKLFKMLDDDQKKIAHQPKDFPEPEQNTIKAKLGDPVGLVAEKMNGGQQALLLELVSAYANRMPPEIAKVQLKEVKDAGVEKIRFAFTGNAKRGSPHTYRVQGPTFVIEFLNTQPDSAGNPANHIHSVWRNIPSDFGLSEKGS